ncbi:DUF3786 domain-containing protein [Chloroflexota bacterium]
MSRNAKAVFNNLASQYVLPVFGVGITVSPTERRICGDSQLAESLLRTFQQYSRLSILWYLINSKDVPLSGNLINPDNFSGGSIFKKGSHVLPFNRVLERFGKDKIGFLAKGRELGGDQLGYADASFQLFPFPRVPVVLLLWLDDGEFPARANILFDATCSKHLPIDVIWSTAMMSVLLCSSEK